MKHLIIFVFCFVSASQAQEKKSDPEDVRRDVRMVCELAKLGQALLSTPEFKNDKITVAFRISEMIQAALKTSEAKKAYSGLSEGNGDSKREGWRKIAVGAGIKNWDCPAIGIMGG